MQIREQIEQLMNAAIADAVRAGDLPEGVAADAALERPHDLSNGDWASTVAMRSAKAAHRSPRDIAAAIVAHIPENDKICGVEVAGPGFINLRVSLAMFQDVVAQVRLRGASFGKGTVGAGERRVNIEYISANPTGPMHVGHGRWAALGDATARVMAHAGYDMHQEFYVNDHGTQMDVFANSVSVRYQQLLGRDVPMPEQCYGGAYVRDIAQAIIDEDGDRWLDVPDAERCENFRERAYAFELAEQHRVTAEFGVHFDTWFSERTLYEKGEDGTCAVDRALAAMRERGYVFEQDGATWFRSTAFGDDKDRVLIKANGEYTYFTSDVAYHYNKLERGFDRLIDIWGADHHGYIARCQAMMEAWGRPGALEVMLGQLVNLFRDGKPVRMSKRTGEMVTFEELLCEVGVDSTRWMMLSRSADQMIDFDIDVAKKRDETNPVYYVQYAHARICSILRKAAPVDLAARAQAGKASMDEVAAAAIPADVDLAPLTAKSEIALMRLMDGFTDLVAQAARDRAAYRLTHYAQDLAGAYHAFYTECRVLTDDAALTAARLALCDAARIVLALTLSLLGISAPAHM